MAIAHYAAAGGGAVYMGYASTLLTGWHGLDAAHATAAAGLIGGAAAAAYAFVAWWVSWRYPKAPPLPGQAELAQAAAVISAAHPPDQIQPGVR